MGESERMRSQYTEDDLDQMDRAIHIKLGHSNLSAHLAAPRYTRDRAPSRDLIDILADNIAWFNIDKLDTGAAKHADQYDGSEWELTLCNVRAMTVRGPTYEIAIAKAILLDGILKRLSATVEVTEIDTAELGGEDAEEEEG